MKKQLLLLLLPIVMCSQTPLGDNLHTIGTIYDPVSEMCTSLSYNGSILALGSPSSNIVRIYNYINGVWTQIGNDINGNDVTDIFGMNVSLSKYGFTVAISSKEGVNIAGGRVRVYQYIGGVWTQIGNDINGELALDAYGMYSNLSGDGLTTGISARRDNNVNSQETGQVSIYKYNNGTWTQVGDDIDGKYPKEGFGNSFCFSDDGSIVAVTSRAGYVRVYKNKNGNWIQIGSDIENLGHSISLSSDGTILASGNINNYENGINSGHVKIYKNVDDVWTQMGESISGKLSGEGLGSTVGLSNDGSIVAIGAPYHDGLGSYSGAVRIYQYSENTWIKKADIIGDGSFEYAGSTMSLSTDGSIVAIGSLQSTSPFHNHGSVKIYDLTAVLSTDSFKKDFFSYYPNPVINQLNINLNKGFELNQVNIYNLQSQYLYSAKTSKIDVSNLSSGIYFVEVETNKGTSTRKIVIE